jgi:putative Mg2+ transporter-C (MgtC) family protein
MSLPFFLLNIGSALLLGVLIGLERQAHRHPAGLRTNALVCVGAALFVTLPQLVGPDASPTRVAAQVVSGIGFLGAGVIFREGANVRGMNTAATLWCSAAIGVLSGSGYVLHAAIGTAAVVLLHLALRPLGARIDARLRTARDVDTYYQFKVECSIRDEGIIRTILLRHVNADPRMTIQRISTRDTDQPDRAVVLADIYAAVRNDREMEHLMSRINIEPGVSSVSWEKSGGDGE